MLLSSQKDRTVATKRQIAANRQNAKKCTGPKTQQGKATSAGNALKHGLDAKREILPAEDPDALVRLTAEYYDRQNPATPEARAIVDALIRNEWLRRRYLRIETAIWHARFSAMETPDLAAAFSAAAEPLCRVGRRQNVALRDYIRALNQLEAHRNKQLNRELVSFLISKKLAFAPSESPASHPVLDSTFGLP